MNRQRLVLAVGVAVLAAVVVYAVLYLNRGDTEAPSSRDFPREPGGTAFIDEAVVFDELGRMTASADLVVRGTTGEVSTGLTHTYGGEGADEVDRLVGLRIDEVVFARGPRPEPGSEITLVEGWWSEGVGFEVEGMPWSEPGTEGWFYLVADPGYPPGTYTYIGTTGRAQVAGGLVQVSGDPHSDGPWDDLVAGVAQPGSQGVGHSGEAPRPVVEELIATAAGRAASGAARPVARPEISKPN